MQKITEKEISLTISPDDYVFVTQPVVREDGSTIDALRRVKLSSILSLFSGGGSAPGESGGTTDHSKLSNRDAADQHPIEAITGLREILDEVAGSGGNVDVTIDGETLVISEKNTATIENETLIL